jgi:hypothetical protein
MAFWPYKPTALLLWNYGRFMQQDESKIYLQIYQGSPLVYDATSGDSISDAVCLRYTRPAWSLSKSNSQWITFAFQYSLSLRPFFTSSPHFLFNRRSAGIWTGVGKPLRSTTYQWFD